MARHVRLHLFFGLFSVMALLAAFVTATTSQAVPVGGFESADGNLVNGGHTDWNDFASGTPSGFDGLTLIPDRRGNPDDIFGGGVKQDKACPGTKANGSLGGGDSKFDISRLYLTHAEVGGDDFLYLAWVRVPQNSTTSSSHVAFEFNQSTETCTSNANPDNPDLIERTEGDKLLVYDFEGGTTTPTLKLLTWIISSGDGPCEAGGSVPCWAIDGGFDASDWDARVNVTSTALDANPNPDQTLGLVEFGEAGINLTNAVDNVCAFSGHVTGVARSSGSSGTAQMKDKVGPEVFELDACVAETQINSNISLDDHAVIAGFGTEGVGDPMGSLTFSLYGPNDPDCEGSPVYETTIADIDSSNNGVASGWSTADGDHPDPSYIVPTNAEGEYSWVVHYTGDEFNTESFSQCGFETATVSYTPPEE